MSQESVCTPAVLMERTPCLGCLSQTDLKNLLLIAVSAMSNYDIPTDLDQLLQDSGCFTCLSKKQRLQAIVTMLIPIFFERTPENFSEVIGCMRCMKPDQVDAATVLLICQLFTPTPAAHRCGQTDGTGNTLLLFNEQTVTFEALFCPYTDGLPFLVDGAAVVFTDTGLNTCPFIDSPFTQIHAGVTYYVGNVQDVSDVCNAYTFQLYASPYLAMIGGSDYLHGVGDFDCAVTLTVTEC